jgi:hydrogenase expression/formation protein HypD
MQVLCSDREMKIDGFMCPGHVSAIIGEGPYLRIVKEFHKPCVISGFEPLDMVLSLYMLARQIKERKARVENEYSRVVKPEGNIQAMKLLYEVFEIKDASWRGFGTIKKSGLFLRSSYKEFDAEQFIPKEQLFKKAKLNNCLCAEVVKGKISPQNCPQFRKTCSPDDPKGPCMVSFEGSCRIHYEYGG